MPSSGGAFVRGELDDDLSWSAETFVKTWPLIHEACGCTNSALIPIENVNRGPLNALDLTSGIDYMATTMHGGLTSIAARVQRPPHLYASFTVRLSRRTGTPTEWAKRVRSFKYDEVLPNLTAQIYVDGNGVLVGYGIVKTRALIEYLLVGPDFPGYNYTVKNVSDGNRLMAVWWLWMRRDGIPLVTSGEARLRQPLKPWHVPLDTKCQRCNHQIGCHVSGRSNTGWRSGWAIYDRIWEAAAGGCAVKTCECPAAYRPRIGESSKFCYSCGGRLDPVLTDVHPLCAVEEHSS